VSPAGSQNSLPSTLEASSEPVTKRLKIQNIEIIEKPFENDDSNVVNGLETVQVLSKKSASASEKDLLAIYAKTSSKISKLKTADKANESVITEFFKDNKTNEDDSFADFEPKRRRILPTVSQTTTRAKKKTKAPRSSKSDKKKQSDIRKMINKNYNDEQILDELITAESAAEQICPYELQLAIALSKSILKTGSTESERDTLVNDGASSSSTSNGVDSTQERVNSLKHTLEQYGFKCKNSYDGKSIFHDFLLNEMNINY
jgi:hypothetical protein